MTQEKSAPENENTETQQPEAATAGIDSEQTSLEERLERARAEAMENMDKFLRAKAESDNIRRRAEQEITHARKFAVEPFAAELLAVKDSLELAAKVEIEADNAEALMQMREGLELTLKQLESAFEKFSIVRLAPEAGEKFNPEHHQAMSMVESAEVDANHILQTIQSGYMIHERLLRPAMVIVAKAPASPAPGDNGPNEGAG